ncbi:MAG: hypothetical protein B6I38_01770 [Anaerolineaceae bacterium 4572_5.1]|nr:MAG: hypothetical protein B6I38_01770 [Anaerolineaceae bacterium 4572_5.1]
MLRGGREITPKRITARKQRKPKGMVYAEVWPHPTPQPRAHQSHNLPLQEKTMFARLKNICQEFPSKFWVVVITSFIDSVGGTLLFPLFSLYITQKFNVGMTQAGVILGIFSVFGLLGGNSSHNWPWSGGRHLG